jgi:hypothetical protein
MTWRPKRRAHYFIQATMEAKTKTTMIVTESVRKSATPFGRLASFCKGHTIARINQAKVSGAKTEREISGCQLAR